MVWEVNTITLGNIIAAVVGVATLVALWFIFKGTRAAQATANVAVSEAEYRNRPWMRFYKPEVLLPSTDLVIRFGNIGALPAEDVTLTTRLVVLENQLPEGGMDLVRRHAEYPVVPFQIIFPKEEGEQTYQSTELKIWRIAGANFSIQSELQYKHGDQQHVTGLEGTVIFSPNRPPEIGWQHTGGT